MNRPWKIWLVFGLSLAVLLAATGWLSWTALRLDRAQARAQQQAELEEKVRLALWRLDSMLAPLIAQESARPYFVYRPFYAADRAFNRFFNAAQPGDTLVPSPLLTPVSSNVLLHFQFTPGGRVTSPQVPTGRERELAEANYVLPQAIEAAAARLRQFEQIMNQAAAPELVRQVRSPGFSRQTLSSPNAQVNLPAPPQGGTPNATVQKPVLLNSDVLVAACPPPTPGANPRYVTAQPPPDSQWAQTQPAPQKKGFLQQEDYAQQQAGRNVGELQARAQTVQQTFDLNVKNSFLNFPPTPGAALAEGTAKPFWFGDALVLARRVSVQGQDYIQGCWLDWPGIRRWLLEGVKDLLPRATLEPLQANGTDAQARMLASLPVRIGSGAPPSGFSAGFSPMLFVLLVAWACMVLAATAVAVLLHGAVSLSERRGAFVSAVTHELRTPLTTFKMYSEMLAEGMVADEAKRKHYLSTLCSEANRLSHLVENVLAYARLERGSARSRVERVSLGELLERVKPRLVERAAQAGLTLAEDADARALQTVVHVDVSAVEQILFNLVDNACKYAAPHATEKVIHLEALPDGRFAMLRVRDHGQGISAEGAKRLFRPFSKSAHEAAQTAPGVGLGLALSRRLSRSMGGDLRLAAGDKGGACFVLILPRSAPGPATIA